MIFDRGALLLVPFPFTDLSGTKRRPVLALTRPDAYGDFVALPVTSRPYHVNALTIAESDLAGASLPVTSWIRTDRVVTLNANLVVRSIAQLTEPAVRTAVQALCSQLGRG